MTSLEDREIIEHIHDHRSPGGRLKILSFEGDIETDTFCLITSGITLGVFVLVTLGFYVFGAEWTVWHWVVGCVLSAFPGFFAFMLGLGVFVERFSQYRHYRQVLGEAKRRNLSY